MFCELAIIAVVQTDLGLSGVSSVKAQDAADPLIKRAIVLYAKANYGWDNPEADRFQKCYDLLKISLTLSGDYTEETQ
jgi:hypothetical protein